MFIEKDKFAKLREDAKNGNDKAKNFLKSYMDGSDEETLSSLMVEYDTPEQEVEVVEETQKNPLMERLQKFLDDNNIQKGTDDYDEAVEMFNQENPVPVEEEEHCCSPTNVEDLIADEVEAVEGYNQAVLDITNSDIPDTIKTSIIAVYNEITAQELEHIEKLKKVKADCQKLVEKSQNI